MSIKLVYWLADLSVTCFVEIIRKNTNITVLLIITGTPFGVPVIINLLFN